MEPNIEEVAGRIRALREDLEITQQEICLLYTSRTSSRAWRPPAFPSGAAMAQQAAWYTQAKRKESP